VEKNILSHYFIILKLLLGTKNIVHFGEIKKCNQN